MVSEALKMTNSTYHISEMQIETEAEIIRAAQKDIQKFEHLYKVYYPRVVAFVYQRVHDKETAYEITSQVFYSALQKLKDYQPAGIPFGAWLYRIAFNKLHDMFRKEKRQRTVNLDAKGLHLLEEEVQADEMITDKNLFEALQGLEEDEMELIEMRFFENRPFKEIGQIRNLEESACKMRVYRILEKLKLKLKK